MNILITNCHLSIPHGSEIFTLTIAGELKGMGHDVYIFSPTYGEFSIRYMKGNFKKVHTVAEDPDLIFDIAITQHLNAISGLDSFNYGVLPKFQNARIINICHGIHAEPEKPIKADWLKGAAYVCISPEIANHYPDFNWNVIKQPIAPEWFAIEPKETTELKTILWGSHRFIVPGSLRKVCDERGIEIISLMPGTMVWPETILEYYERADLVIGTGRWIYQAMAAGRPCIVANNEKFLWFLTERNTRSFESYNMTMRHPDSTKHPWETTLDAYIGSMGKRIDMTKNIRDYAIENYTASKVVQDILNTVDA